MTGTLSSFDTLAVAITPPFAFITLNRPDVKNAMNAQVVIAKVQGAAMTQSINVKRNSSAPLAGLAFGQPHGFSPRRHDGIQE